jgi:hypothetical protein
MVFTTWLRRLDYSVYHRHVQESKLSCPAPRYRTATKYRLRATVADWVKQRSQIKKALTGLLYLAPHTAHEPFNKSMVLKNGTIYQNKKRKELKDQRAV